MLSLRPEIEQLISDGHLPADRAALLIAIEERNIVSVHALLRFLLWGGVALIVGGAGAWFSANAAQLGPAIVTLSGAALAMLAYGFAFLLRQRAGEHGVAAEYLGLLGALLLSADVAFAESQFVILANWTHHLLILASIHAAYAYATRNRLVFTVAVTSLAAWFGVDQHEAFSLTGIEGGLRLLGAASAILVWRLMHLRYSAPYPRFERVLEHAVVHLGFWGTLVMIADNSWQWLGIVLLLVIASLVGLWIRSTEGHDLQFIWIAVYTLVGIDILIVENLDAATLVILWLTISSLAAVFGLITFFIRRREET